MLEEKWLNINFDTSKHLSQKYPFYTLLRDFYKVFDNMKAINHYQKALELAKNEGDRGYIERLLKEIKN
jgi:predicted RNA polymerase sigma factor